MPITNKETILVTGANRGLGKTKALESNLISFKFFTYLKGVDVVRILAANRPEAVILLGSRSLENGVKAADSIRNKTKKQAEIEPIQIDVQSKSSITSAGIRSMKIKSLSKMFKNIFSNVFNIRPLFVCM